MLRSRENSLARILSSCARTAASDRSLRALAALSFNRPTAALTSAKAIDSANTYANVGVIMVWRDANNPLGRPGGLATYVTGVLIHSQTILTAGHFTAGIEGVATAGQLPPRLRIVASFAPNAFDQSTWIELNRALGTCVTHPSLPKPCTPQSCPFDDIDGRYEPGISDVGLCFLDEPVRRALPAQLTIRTKAKRPISASVDGDPRKLVPVSCVALSVRTPPSAA
jgi:hypothetical protein